MRKGNRIQRLNLQQSLKKRVKQVMQVRKENEENSESANISIESLSMCH